MYGTVSLFLFVCGILDQVHAFGTGFCYHNVSADQLTVGVHLESHTVKRQAGQGLRIAVYYDSTVTSELDNSNQNRLQNVVMPAVTSFLESALNPVLPASAPLLLDRDCVGGIFYIPVPEVRQCVNACDDRTFCGIVQVPEDHLKRCVQCNGNVPPNCETVGVDGSGVNDADLVLYVSTSSAAPCGPGSLVLAFAAPCQLEATLDRPFAGYVNFCPNQFISQTNAVNIAVAKHEITHALGFSQSLYPYFRDENGNPRTLRNQFGIPVGANGPYTPSENTLRTVTYTDWQTRTGAINHTVNLFVTPNIIEEGRRHYNCSVLEGVEVENQGGSGTATSHWESRVLGNEVMTGVISNFPRFSRLTLALLQDSGWYDVNYEVAEDLRWGRDSGCRFAHGSCGEWIDTRINSGRSLAPFCNRLVFNSAGSVLFPVLLQCTVNRLMISFCNLREYSVLNPDRPLSEYQYFNTGPNFDSSIAPRVGGTSVVTDYCPYEQALSFGLCSDPVNQHANNIDAETYGLNSRCVEQGQVWTRTSQSDGTVQDSDDDGLYGGGCYQYICSVNGVLLEVLGNLFRCSCEGEELLINITVSGFRYQGSLICPSCSQICYDEIENCTLAEPPCHGRSTMATSARISFESTSYTVREDLTDGKHFALLICAIAAEITQAVTVNISTANATAVEGEDFESVNEELMFNPDQGILRQCICINILDDSMLESDEEFSVVFSSSDPVAFVSNSASVIILDNDNGMSASCAAILQVENELTESVLIKSADCIV